MTEKRRLGGLSAKEKNLAKDPDFYKKIGAKGGSAPYTGKRGFAAIPPELRREYGQKGGKVSKQSKKDS